jgi:hypothetical protein
VLVTGGEDSSAALARARNYDPAAGLGPPAACHRTRISRRRYCLRQGACRGRYQRRHLSRERGTTIRRPTLTATAASPLDAVIHATLLPNGKVLTRRFQRLPSRARNHTIRRLGFGPDWQPCTARDSHTATLLPNGKVLVAGGTATALARARNSMMRRWHLMATGSFATARVDHTATLLPNGEVSQAVTTEPISRARNLRYSNRTRRHWQPCHRTLCSDGYLATAGCLSQAVTPATAALSRARNFSIRSGAGQTPAASPSGALIRRRRLLPNARCSSWRLHGVVSLASAELFDPVSGPG